MQNKLKLNRNHWKHQLRNDLPLYIMLIIPLAYFIIFCYWPMFGLSIAFQNYKVGQPFFSEASRWVGLRWFEQFLNYPFAGRLVRNTVILGVYSLAVTFPLAILLALLLNEIQHRRLKKFTTTLSFLPYFISTTVIVGMLTNFFNVNDGIVNQAIESLGGTPIDFMGSAKYFRHLYVFSGAWQTVGFNAVVFSAAIAGIDPGLYEAAYVDGSTRVKNIYLITLPCIRSTIIVMFILRVGSLLNVGFEKVILMYSERIYETADVLSTYSYRAGILDNKWGYSTAIGLMNSVVNLILIVGANALSRKLSETSLW